MGTHEIDFRKKHRITMLKVTVDMLASKRLEADPGF